MSHEYRQALDMRGLGMSTMVPEAMEQLVSEINDKVPQGQANVVLLDDIKNSPPEELKVSLIAMIPHNSRGFVPFWIFPFLSGLLVDMRYL